MQVKFSPDTKDDFGRYKEYLQELKKSDKEKYHHISPEKSKKKLRDNIGSSIGKKEDHSDSIFPKEFDYGCDSHKMYIDKKSHHIVFYKIVTPKTKGSEPYISIKKCIHSTRLKKKLDKKGIEPLEDSDPKLLLDYITIEKEDKVNNETLTDEERKEYKKREDELKERISNKSKETKEEITDPETGKKIKKVKHTGPRGGHYYINDNGEHIYPEEWNESIKNMKSVKSYITESKMVSLIEYLKKMVG